MSPKHVIAVLWLLACCTMACSPTVPQTAEPQAVAAVEPQPDEVRFYERPAALEVARKSALPAPLVVLLERDPWAMVIGSDSPAFALYEDGTVIQRAASGFTMARLTEGQTKQLVDRLNLRALARSYGRFVAEDATDQPEQDLLVYADGKPIFVSVYGSLKDREVRAKVPKEVVAAYDTLRAFRPSASRPWLPENVEVMVWPYEYAPDPSIEWPAEWPDLTDPGTISRDKGLFSIYLPSARLAELQAFLKRRQPKGAVEINGRKWTTSLRFPFPHESLWMVPDEEPEGTAP